MKGNSHGISAVEKGYSLSLPKLFLLCLLVLFTGLFLYNPAKAQLSNTALVLTVDGAIGPATADYIERGLKKAHAEQDKLVILQLDTPGGLDKSMRAIIKAMILSPIPIITYVAPSGARAASAGTYILYASPIAAMAPGTNLGAATPVNLGEPDTPAPNEKKSSKKSSNSSDMERKMKNDAVAYIESLSALHNRNTDWAKKAVTEAASLPATEALRIHVIDIIAPSIENLLSQVNGKTLLINNTNITLNTSDMTLRYFNPDWRTRFLETITDPTIAYILLLIAVYGLFFEFANPGFVLPGVTGAIALLLALYALHLLPINYVGLALILLGIAFMVAEVFVASFGTLGIGGIIAFLFGSILLMDTQASGYGIPLSLIILMTLINGLFFFFIIGMAIKSRRRPIVSGRERLIGQTFKITENCLISHTVLIQGEHWKFTCKTPLKEGETVVVINVHDLTLEVQPTE